MNITEAEQIALKHLEEDFKDSDDAKALWPLFQRLSAELTEAKKDSKRLKWLHSGGWEHRPGWQWGVAEIQFDQAGQVVSALWGLSDSSDIDAAMDQEEAEYHNRKGDAMADKASEQP